MYHLDADVVVILDVFSKKTESTPQGVLNTCRKRLAAYLLAAQKTKKKE